MDIVSLPMDLVGSVISFLDRRSVWGGLLSASRGAASLRDHECLLRRNEARGFRTIRVDASCPKWQIDRSLALRGYCVLDVAIPASGERRVVVRTEPLPVPNDTEIVPSLPTALLKEGPLWIPRQRGSGATQDRAETEMPDTPKYLPKCRETSPFAQTVPIDSVSRT
eukprot:Polyplicarium_translucidae@DN3139_c0_g1_i10.p1